MPVDDVLDDGKAQPGPADGARAAFVHPVEPLGEARNICPRDAGAIIGHADQHPARLKPRVARRRPGGEPDQPFALAVFDRVVQQVGENLRKLIGIGRYPGQIRRHSQHQA